jgi:hypothetical protein
LFSRLNEEFQTANKKKQALNSLLDTGKISQPTYDLFNKEINQAITEIERQQQTLLDKMNNKTMELADQIKTLEMLLANYEIQHVTNEIDEETYTRENELLTVSLETTRHELNTIKDAMKQLAIDLQPEPIEVPTKEENQPHPEIEVIQLSPKTNSNEETQPQEQPVEQPPQEENTQQQQT